MHMYICVRIYMYVYLNSTYQIFFQVVTYAEDYLYLKIFQ